MIQRSYINQTVRKIYRSSDSCLPCHELGLELCQKLRERKISGSQAEQGGLRQSCVSHLTYNQTSSGGQGILCVPLTGWGAFCNKNSVRGFWSDKELKLHINSLELVTAFKGLKCFDKDESNSNILLIIDNTTPIAGSNPIAVPQSIANKIWQWCENILMIFESYIKSSDNFNADKQPRHIHTGTEYELNHSVFLSIVKALGKPDIDFFASKINAKCDIYVSWHGDPDPYHLISHFVVVFYVGFKHLQFVKYEKCD